MATVSPGRGSTGDGNELATGDHMTREEFHRIYAATDDAFRAELIGGIVYVPSPLKRRHGVHHLLLGALFAAYAARTPGVEAGDNATVLLGEDAEPQPDLYLRLLPESGGQSRAGSSRRPPTVSCGSRGRLGSGWTPPRCPPVTTPGPWPRASAGS